MKPAGLLDQIIHYGKVVFRFLFMNGPSEAKAPTSRLNPQLAQALPILEREAEEQNPDALFVLAEMNLYGNFTHPRDYWAAFDQYEALASLTGNATAQNIVGFFYATGLGGVERHQGKSLLYHTFAADQGNTKSEMTVAFRHHSGIGTPRDCDKAAHYYKKVADKAMAYWKAGPPGGRSMPKESYRWSDEEGGLYGEGASVSSAGLNANRETTTMEDIMEYLDMESREGDLKATFSLGKLHYEGSRTMKRNFRKAQRHFHKVAKAYWKDGQINPNAPKNIEKIAGKAAAHLGRMFLRGEGMEQSYQKAHHWFKRGIQNGDAYSQYHMGLMYLEGLGVPTDGVKAASFLKAAAEQDLANAQSALGTLFLDQGEIDTAIRYFELAARHGHMEAFYYLAELANKGIGRDRHCGMATAYYKIVAEKAERLHSNFAEANTAYEIGDTETALILSMMAAEQGYENAQVNVAYLLDSQRSALDLRRLLNPFAKSRSSHSSLTRIKPLALIYFTRSAKQSNVDSLLKAGDYYLHGTASPNPNLEAASTCYHTAAEGHHSAQAFWNLGWMHENGIAVHQDFHMAKRYYDLALETNSEAYLPVKIALGKLRLRSWWNSITGGDVNSIRPDSEDDPDSPSSTASHSWTLGEWLRHFWENAEEQAYFNNNPGNHNDPDDLLLVVDPNDPLAQAADDTAGAGAGIPNEVGGDQGDIFDDFLGGDYDTGIFESLIIIGLAGLLAALVFWRQQIQLQRQRERQRARDGVHRALNEFQEAHDEFHGNRRGDLAQPQQQAQGQGQGQGQAVAEDAEEPPERDPNFFPQPGDPEYPGWVAGGVGH